jgi:hypothetical protein
MVHSRNGFLCLPRYEFSTVPALDRVLPAAGENNAAKQQVLAAWSAIQPRQPVEDIYQNVGSGETAYDASLRDLGITFLIDHLPARLHLFLSTRADPPLPLARLRARGALLEVRADDLRFSASSPTFSAGPITLTLCETG